MRITLVGPGRAGTALALAARAAGHEIAGVAARRRGAAADAAALLGSNALLIGEDLPSSDLAVLATRDDAIGRVAEELAGSVGDVAAVVHLSGLAPAEALSPIAAAGVPTGSFHPLQSLPTPEAGAASLAGSWVAVTAGDDGLRGTLHDLAGSIGAVPFDLADESKALYHAAASASANFPLVALVIAADLFEEAGVPFAAAGPLVDAVVANAFSMGPRAALTGPVARGDVATVAAQLDAVAGRAPEHVAAYRHQVMRLAALTGRSDQFEGLTSDEEGA